MNFENDFNNKALAFYAKRENCKVSTNSYTSNLTPTYINPFTQKQMQFNSWTNYTSDNSDKHVPFEQNICGNKTPNQKNMLNRKKIAMSVCNGDD